MEFLVLQSKIDHLLSYVYKLLPVGRNMNYIYADDLSELNNVIHNQINELYSQWGNTVEQDASLCFALLMGYSVSMYANPDDEIKKQHILIRSQQLLQILPPSSLKEQLLTICNEFEYKS